MSTTGQFSSKNPTIKRILKEASELNSIPSPDYHAAPLESDLFEWHFTIRGPPDPSPFQGGLYHGRIVLPPAYPLKPPSFRFLTPSGRFEINREICLSISGHHEETWQPAWGIRTALVAIRSFMDTDAKGQVGGMDASNEARKRMALQSPGWRCATCSRPNLEIMREQDVNAAGVDKASAKIAAEQDVVPQELRLAYREDLNGDAGPKSTQDMTSAQDQTGANGSISTLASTQSLATAAQHSAVLNNTSPTVAQLRARQPQTQQEPLPAWIDKAIAGVFLALVATLWYKYQA